MGFTQLSHGAATPRGVPNHWLGCSDMMLENRVFPKVTLTAGSDAAWARGAWHLAQCQHGLTFFVLPR